MATRSGRKVSRNGRSEGRPRFIQIEYWIMETPAFLALSSRATRALFFMLKRFNGTNNGKIAFGVRSGCFVRLKVQMKAGAAIMSIDHPDQNAGQAMLMQSLGTANSDFLTGLLSQLANAGSSGKETNQDRLNFMLSVVQGIEARDQVEAMLATQMAATHNAIMTFARRLNHVETLQQQDSAERAFNKLARTFASQVEALKRYRSNGDQTVRVEHVTVNEGGQAIVGNVTGMGRGAPDKTGTTP